MSAKNKTKQNNPPPPELITSAAEVLPVEVAILSAATFALKPSVTVKFFFLFIAVFHA